MERAVDWLPRGIQYGQGDEVGGRRGGGRRVRIPTILDGEVRKGSLLWLKFYGKKGRVDWERAQKKHASPLWDEPGQRTDHVHCFDPIAMETQFKEEREARVCVVGPG